MSILVQYMSIYVGGSVQMPVNQKGSYEKKNKLLQKDIVIEHTGNYKVEYWVEKN